MTGHGNTPETAETARGQKMISPRRGEGIVVGVDGSDGSLASVHWSVTEAGLRGVGVHLVMAWQQPQPYGAANDLVLGMDPSGDMGRILADAAEIELSRFGAEAEQGQRSVISREAVEGHPAEVLVQAGRDAAMLADPASVGLDRGLRAVLFDLDGVLTRTARVHAAAWKEMFDAYLRKTARRTGTPFVAFDAGTDYDRYVDGKSRDDGTRSFLAARDIILPEGSPQDRAGMGTVQGLGKAKNEIVLRRMREDGVEVFEGSVRYVQAVRRAGLRCAVVSSSTNCQAVLAAAHIEDLFDRRIDGLTARDEKLPGKPAPDMFLAAAHALGMTPGECAVVEDALAGVEAGRAGGFGQVIGVDRAGQAQALLDRGADIVVSDLAELLAQP
jgi:beta-phosphoglucomutase family hydrolase